MSSKSAIRSYEVDADRGHSGFAIIAVIGGIIILIAVAVAATHVITQLDSMASSLAHVNASLDTLHTMNQKLDRLDLMSLTLRQMNEKLAITNRSLDAANQKLSSMARDSASAGKSLEGMRSTLSEMRNDIRVMSHKISRSFLFRSIKWRLAKLQLS